MSAHTDLDTPSRPGAPAAARLRARTWRRFLRGPDPTLLEELYVPALSAGVRYDRCCAYFRSSVLAAAARGFGPLIHRLGTLGDRAPRPAIRLLVNEELSREDVRALTEAGDLSRLEALLQQRLQDPVDALEKERLAMLAWLARRGLLEVRVGVMRQGAGLLHAKFGIITDEAGDAVTFSGSGNESAQGLLANYERLEVPTSWQDPDRHQEYSAEFDALWRDRHPDVHTVPLPEAVRLRLVRFAPAELPAAEPATNLARQKAAMACRFLVEAPYLPDGGAACDATALVDLWPHQRHVVTEAAEAWPAGRLLCDEVGMGKTVEAVLVLRRLLAGRGVRRVLVLLPAGLLRRWQAELREKGGLCFARLESTTSLVWPDDRVERVAGLGEALRQDWLLLSRETARTPHNLALLLDAPPWDLVILDEAHAARRREQEEGEFNSGTLLLTLLRQLQLRRRARGLLLLSATPMQTHPWEPWDLLGVLGEGGAWLADFGAVRDFYKAVAAVRAGTCSPQTARRAAALIVSDALFPPVLGKAGPARDPQATAGRLAFATPGQRAEVVRWLRQGSPLARRMRRNTRGTLRHYHEAGRLSVPPPRRVVSDIVFDYRHRAEREVYEAVGQYIEARFRELEAERPGKGFVMTIYRRRAASSPHALQRSLERRRDGLRRVAERKAYDGDLSFRDAPDALDADDLAEGEGGSRISSALPQDQGQARAELEEVNRVLDRLHDLHGRDSKRDQFFETLRQLTADGRPALVFTEYTDTLEYLRDALIAHYGPALGCYSGDGGAVWENSAWKPVTKDFITRALRQGQLRVLLCTDAASEGLNLQAASALINYDLPWNPSKVEQRIGRIDRIGQQMAEVRVVNLFLKDTIDDRVYRVLRQRCGLFEHFVGAMQPVLARARRMLLGQEPLDVDALQTTAAAVEADPVTEETYLEGVAEGSTEPLAPLTRAHFPKVLAHLQALPGYQVRPGPDAELLEVSGPGLAPTTLGATVEALERDRMARPLSPFDPCFRQLADDLWHPGERLPLVVGSRQQGAFRRSVAYWVDAEGVVILLQSMDELLARVAVWDGAYPNAATWLEVQERAEREAEAQVAALQEQAVRRELAGLRQQHEAARLRLVRELGRYLVCLGAGATDLNGLFHEQMQRHLAGAQRLRRCFEALGKCYPEWTPEVCLELEAFAEGLTENQRKARLLGRELEAALEDPRWAARI